MNYKDSFKVKQDRIKTNHGWYSIVSTEDLVLMEEWFELLKNIVESPKEEDLKKFSSLTLTLNKNKHLVKLLMSRHLEEITDQIDWELDVREILETEECPVEEAIEVATYER